MKKITLSLVTATLSMASLDVYAAIPTGASPFQIVIPNLSGGIEFTLEGLYLQPTSPNLAYVSTTTGTYPNTATNTTYLTPDYDFGLALGVGYIFPNSGNDIQANWTHFDHSTSDAVLSGVGTAVTGVLDSKSHFIPSPTETINATSNASFQYDAVDLDVGQHMSMGSRLQTRFFAGLRYANLKNDITDTYTEFDSALPTEASVETVIFNSQFTGIGPRVGVDTSYYATDCFGVVTHLAAALLVGRVESSTTDVTVDTSERGTITTTQNLATNNQTRVVPAFDAKLGLNYTLGFKNGTSNMTVETGYQVTQYVDPIDRLYDGYTTTSSVGFNGPYLSLNFKI